MSTSGLGPQCWSCRRRRVRCGSEQPACLKCRDKSINCPGYGDKKPLVWVEGPNSHKRRRKPSGKPSAPSIETPTRIKLEETIPVVPPEQKSALTTPSLYTNQILDNGLWVFPPEIVSLVRDIDYYNRVIPGALSLIPGSISPFRIEQQAWHNDMQISLGMISLVVAQHRLIRSRCAPLKLESAETEQALEIDAHRHTAVVVSGLNDRLRSPTEQFNIVTFVCVVLVLLSEVQRCACGPAWAMHLNGTLMVVRLHGGVQSLLRVYGRHVTNLIVYLILIDVMGSTTCRVLPEQRTSQQLEYMDIVPDLFNHGVWTVMPCPEVLLRIIIQVNELRLRSSRQQRDGETSTTQIQARNLLVQLDSVDVSTWAKEAVVVHDLSSILRPNQWCTRILEGPPSESQVAQAKMSKSHDSQLWNHVGHVYKSAVTLYLMRSVLFAHFDPSSTLLANNTDSLYEVRLAHAQNLHEHLESIFTTRGPNMPFHFFVLWPMVIAGLEMDAQDPKSQTIWLERFSELAVSTGSQAMVDASGFLKRYWSRGLSASDTTLSWEDIFADEDPCVFVM